MFYAWCNFTFIPNIKQQPHKQESKMLIEHTNRSIEDKPKIHLTWSTKYMFCGALRWSTGCFNQQSLYTVSQPECVTQPSRTTSTTVNPKSTLSSQRSTQNNNNRKSTQPSQIERPASVFVPKIADWGDQSFGRVSGQFDQALTKVNAGQFLHWKP